MSYARSARKPLAWVMGLLIAVMGLYVSMPAAYADGTGTFNSFELEQVYDGTNVPNSLDNSASNGQVATNDSVGYKWNLNVTDVEGATMSQTLPEGWTWDPSSFGTIDSDNSSYRTSYTLSPDGRTLTVTYDSAAVTQNPTVVSLGVLIAKPSESVASQSVYTPTVTIDHPSTPAITQGPPVTVLSQPTIVPEKYRYAQNQAGTFDFGAGAEPARYIDFRIAVGNIDDVIGARDTELAQPATLRDSFELYGPDAFLNATFVPEIVGSSDTSASVALSPVSGDPNAYDITLDGFDSLYGQWVEVRFWVKDSEVPSNREGVLSLYNTVNSPGVTDVGGTPAVEVPGDNTASGIIFRLDGGPGSVWPWESSKMIFASETGADLPATLEFDPNRYSQPYTNVTSQVVHPGTMVLSRLEMVPGEYYGTEVIAAASDLIVYDFWDPTQQQLVPTTAPYVGFSREAGGAIDSSNYVIEYTNGTDRSQEQTGNTWYGTIAEAGGVESISGIRVRHLGDWGTGATYNEGHFVVAVPLKIVATEAMNVINEAQWSWTDVNDAPQYGKRIEFVDVGSFSLATGKTVSKQSIISGATLDFVLTPVVRPALGSEPGISVQGLKIVDTLSKGIASVDLSTIPAEWTVVSEEYTDDGIKITFRYMGDAVSGEPLPAISYSAVTSALAPSNSTFVNTAVISADFNSQPEHRRTAQTVTTVTQSEIVSEEKKVYGESLLDVNAPQASWQTRWFNFQTSTQGESYFVDVLPYQGDKGTQISGTATLASVELLDAAGVPAPASYGKLQYTTVNPETVKEATRDPSVPVTWVDAEGYDPTQLAAVTAVRAVVYDFVTGEAGIGAMRLTLDLADMRGGDTLTNVSSGWLGVSGFLGETNPATVDIVSSSLAGVVWNDADGSGTRDTNEEGYPNAAVTLHDASGAQIAATRTGADGSYRFAEIPAGNYTVKTDPQSLGINPRYSIQHTYDHDGDLNSDSGPIAVEKGIAYEPSVDFGYRVVESTIGLTKTGKLAKETGLAVAGDWVDWAFVISNTGDSALTEVELIDHLDGVVDLAIQWDGTPGELAPGESVPATARYALTQADLDSGQVRNTATTLGLDPNTIEVSDDAEAIVTLPEGGSMLLEKVGALVGEPNTDATIRWEFMLTNTGNVTLTGISLQDQLAGLGNITWGAWPDQPFMLHPGETVTASASSSVTQADLDAGCVVNTARAYGVTPAGVDAPSNEADATVCFDIMPSISLVKSTNGVVYTQAPGAMLQDGDAVEWTYEVTNTGPETLNDVLLLDDQEGEIAYPAGFDGTLDPAESVTFTANGTATVQAYHNVATVTGVSPSDMTVTDTDESWYSIETDPGDPGFEITKTADPATGTTVTPGQTITYTVTGTNTGTTVLNPVNIADNLSGVNSHASFNGDAIATIDGQNPAGTLDVQFEAGTLTWEGALQPGEAVTITYSVTVNADAAGVTLNNSVTASAQPPGPVPPIVPPSPETRHPVPGPDPEPQPGFEIAKSANPASGTDVRPGQRITYTVTGTNTGGLALDPVVITDDLSGVIAHARYSGDAFATINGSSAAGKLEYNARAGEMVWTGSLRPGEVVTVTYSVVVNANAAGTTLKNSVFGVAQPPGEHPPIETPRVSVIHPVPAPLATTGSQTNTLWIATGSLLLLAAAGVTFAAVRKRRSTTRD